MSITYALVKDLNLAVSTCFLTLSSLVHREVWPDRGEFGTTDISPEEEFMALREIFFANISCKYNLEYSLCGHWSATNWTPSDGAIYFRMHDNSIYSTQVMWYMVSLF